jgi:hypothetical protein
VASDDPSAAYADVGLRLRHDFVMRSRSFIVPELTVGVRTLLTSDTRDATVSLVTNPANTFVSSGPVPDRATGFGSIGVSLERTDLYAVFIRADGQVGESTRQGTLSIGGWLRF